MRTLLRRAGISWLILSGLCTAMKSEGAPEGEYRLKGAILFNVIRFTQWPEEAFSDADAPFVIGVPDDKSIRPALEEIFAKELVRGHPCQIVSTTDLTRVPHVLFVPAGKDQAPETLRRFAGSPILTVSDSQGFCRSGGMVSLLLLNRKVRLHVNPDAISEAGLSMSSSLLNIATLERDDAGGSRE